MSNERQYPKISVKDSPNAGIHGKEPIPEGKGTFERFLGFPRTIVAPGTSSRIVTQTQVPFIPRRLVVASECAPYFDVLAIKIGNAEMTMNYAGAPASCFPPLPHDVKDLDFMKEVEKLLALHMDTIQCSQAVTIEVTNTSAEPAEFRAMFWGILGL